MDRVPFWNANTNSVSARWAIGSITRFPSSDRTLVLWMHYPGPLIGPTVHPIDTGDDPVRVSKKVLNAPERSSLSQSLATGLLLQKRPK